MRSKVAKGLKNTDEVNECILNYEVYEVNECLLNYEVNEVNECILIR